MSNRIGLHAGYFRGTPYENDAVQMLHLAALAGGHVLVLMPAHLRQLEQNQKERNLFCSLLREYDVELIAGAGRSPEVSFTSPQPGVRLAGIESAKETMRLLFDFGVHKWEGLIYGCWPERPDGILTLEEKRNVGIRSAACLQKLLPLARAYDITFGFEVVNRYEHYLMNTAQEGLTYTQWIHDPRAKLVLDVFHMNIEEDDMTQAIRTTVKADKLMNFHIGEANRRVPGTAPSHLDWNGIFSALIDSGYTGPITMEPFVIGGTAGAAQVSLWRDLQDKKTMADFLENISIGIRFVQEHLQKLH